MKLSVAAALRDEALRDAEVRGVAVCVTVVDAGAWLVTSARMDGVPLGVIDVSARKARTVVLFQMDSEVFGKIAHPDGGAYSLENTNGGLTSFGGGILLKDRDGVVLGGLGVSGASTEDDIAIARAAAERVLDF